ncbi:MAG: hypothetical protein ABI639_06615, partial [Thermoanaerobaculia bacterium]
QLSEVVVEGPVSEITLIGEVAFIAGANLTIADLSNPSDPQIVSELALFAGHPIRSMVLVGTRLWTVGESGSADRLIPVNVELPTSPVVDFASSLSVQFVEGERLFAADEKLYRLGVGRVECFAIPPEGTPTLVSSGALPDLTLLDLEEVNSEPWVAIESQGARRLLDTAGALSLGPAPPMPRTALGLFKVAEGGSEVLWIAAGNFGAEAADYERRVDVDCLLRDVVVTSSELFYLTACGVEVEARQ